MKKILVLMMGALCLLSCTKQYITEEHIHMEGHDPADDYCIIDKLFTNEGITLYHGESGEYNFGFDTVRFIKQDNVNVLHLVRTLSYDSSEYPEKDNYYWSTYTMPRTIGVFPTLEYLNEPFNFYIKQAEKDQIKTYNRFRKVDYQLFDPVNIPYRGRGYIYPFSQGTITVKDTIIDIACPHEEIEREYYYHKYSE